MATKWSKKKVNPDNINSGNEYEKGDRVSVQALNSMVESGLYSQEFAEAIVDTPDTSEAGNVGTPAVSFIDNVKNGNTYKKFKFSNLKGATGATPRMSILATVTNSVGTPSVQVTKSGTDADPTFRFAFQNLKGQDGGSEYANTSEAQTSGLNLNTSSTLADLATQILAAKTKVISTPIGANITSANATALRRLLGSPFNGYYARVEFKVFGITAGFESIIEVKGIEQSVSTPEIAYGYLVYNDEGEGWTWQWTGWTKSGSAVSGITEPLTTSSTAYLTYFFNYSASPSVAIITLATTGVTFKQTGTDVLASVKSLIISYFPMENTQPECVVIAMNESGTATATGSAGGLYLVSAGADNEISYYITTIA